MKQNIETKKKTFGGKTEFALDHSSQESLAESKRERHFHQRMLRAYLKGRTHFFFGFDNFGDPVSHRVLINYKEV